MASAHSQDGSRTNLLSSRAIKNQGPSDLNSQRSARSKNSTTKSGLKSPKKKRVIDKKDGIVPYQCQSLKNKKGQKPTSQAQDTFDPYL